MNTTLFKLPPLNRNLAIAIGSALRRYLLSSVPGTAVSAVRIDGAAHEYTRVPGVKENVLQIIENLRQLAIAGTVEDPVWLGVGKESGGNVTAADLSSVEGISCPDAAQHIAALTGEPGSTGLHMEVEVRSGVGHRTAEENARAAHKPGTIRVDSCFSSIVRAWCEVEGEGEGESAAVALGMQTNGATEPRKALEVASHALLKDLQLPFERKELSAAKGQTTSQWLPRGRATTLGNLIEAGLLFGSADDALENVDVSFAVEPGDFLDNPDEERLVLTVKVVAGAAPGDRADQALAELRQYIENAVSTAVTCPEADASVATFGRRLETPSTEGFRAERRFERVKPAVQMDDPLAVQKDSFEQFLARDGSRNGLDWLLRESLNVDAGDGGKIELVDWALGDAARDAATALREGRNYTRPVSATLRVTRPGADVVEQRVRIADVPAMTEHAGFVIRGRERVCIGEIVLAPGVYFDYKSRTQTYQARVVPHHGRVIRFDLGRDGIARVLFDGVKPLDAELLLRALGWEGTPEEAGLPQAIFREGSGPAQPEAIATIGRQLSPDPEADPGAAFSDALLHGLTYGLGETGRERLNRRLGTTGSGELLTAPDVLAILRKLVEMKENEDEVDDLNHAKNLVIRMVGDSLRNSLCATFHRLQQQLSVWLRAPALQTDIESVLGDQVQEALDNFFLRNSLVRDLDTTNRLSMIAQARRVTRSGPNGLDKNRAGLPARYIHPSHYGRFCIIDTPEGQTLGLLRSLGMYTKLDDHGFVLAPYVRVEGGRMTGEVVYLSAGEEDGYTLAPADAARDEAGRLTDEKLMVRKGYDYDEVSPEQVDFIGASPSEILGAPAHALPFIEFDDPNRSLMGLNMSRQAVPILKPEPPIIATGCEAQLTAPEMVGEDDVFALADQTSAPGRNLLVAYVCWEGYNYEDGYVVNERLVRENALTSIHRRAFTIETYQTSEGAERLTGQLPDADPDTVLHLDERGIVRVGETVQSGDIMVGKVKQREDGSSDDASLKMPRCCEGKVVEVEYQARRLGFELPSGVDERVRVTVAVKRRLQAGDKIANRHGAKGVVGLILPEEDMPCLADGTPADLLFGPLCVPSRMNIGQLMEANASLAAHALGLQVVSPPLNGATADDVKALLREAGLPEDGRLQLYDGRTGKPFDQRSTVGFVHCRKLDHMADDAFQARSTGAYDPATQQPVRGRQRRGGQKVGKMEIWALQSHGAAHNLREFLSIKADDAIGRKRIYEAIVEGREEEVSQVPELANLLLRELRAVALDARYVAGDKPVNPDEPYDINQIDEVGISFATPDAIRGWSKGEVVSEVAFDEATGEPVEGGLFCERVFGSFAPADADGAAARLRRMGHIELAAPVLHPWLLKADPSPLCALLGFDKPAIEEIIYCRKQVVIDPKGTSLDRGQLLDDDEYRAAREQHGYDFQVAMGAEAIAKLVEGADWEAAKQSLADRGTPETRADAAEALVLLETLQGSGDTSRRGILEVIPVLPAGLRPAVRWSGERTATSDLNELYERVIKRNGRLKSLLAMQSPDLMLRDEQRLLQEAVGALFGNGYRGHSLRGSSQMKLAALSDRLKGTKGRFIQGLAGKRTDYSARATIAPGPWLKLDEVGMPKEMALEVFRPFVVGELLRTRKTAARTAAERMVDRQREEAYQALKAVVRDKLVLLVRAPALHKYSMLAFRPRLTNERVIRLHPNVTIGFNADFDGDQMTIHVPLSKASHQEAERLLLARHNMFGTASGAMMNRGSQDVILGCYYMTAVRPGAKGEGTSFPSAVAARNAVKAGSVDAHAKIEVGSAETTVGRLMFSDLLPKGFGPIASEIGNRELQDLIERSYLTCGVDRTTELVDDFKHFGFHHATLSGMSVSRMDPYEGRDAFFADMDEQLRELNRQVDANQIDEEKRFLRTIDLWSEAQPRLREDILRWLSDFDDGFFPISMMVRSGARCSGQQMFMLFGMRGLTADMFGRIIEFPVRDCMMGGTGELGYFLKANNARAGLAMTAVRIAPAGDLMRRIVEALEDVLVVEEDCGITRGMDLAVTIEQSCAPPAQGRVAAEDVRTGDGETLVAAGTAVSAEVVERLLNAGIERVKARSPITCESRGGICAKCYGYDVGQKRPVEVGTPVGITAALSLGEPLTQLTMRSFHLGHRYPFSKIARGKPEQDIKYSSGFPRLEEVFLMLEKRRAYGPALDGVDERPSPQAVLDQDGEDAARQFLLNELVHVYWEAGILINSKHFEIALRQMMAYVEVERPGDSGLVAGQRVLRDDFAQTGGEPATFRPLLLPITEISLRTESFLAASASWETVNVLAQAALRERVDRLRGMRENIILGRLIPVGAAVRRH